ncbi:MAG: hypothetical protein EA380_11320 [Phycisphaeraceae bacterium]|nr:MAG: hypothetical protein EA380_11320 [Phycisphaeraceae bacterium]
MPLLWLCVRTALAEGSRIRGWFHGLIERQKASSIERADVGSGERVRVADCRPIESPVELG